MSMILDKLHLLTHLDVWQPKFNDKSLTQDYGEHVALLHKRKVDFATPTIIVTFSKSPHLKGQRFAIKKAYAQQHAIGTNRKAPMYEVPMSHFEDYITNQEIRELFNA